MATWVQALTGLAVGPLRNWVLPPSVPPPDGRSGPTLLLAFRKYASVSRCMIVRQPLWVAVGRIQAERVIAVLRSSEAESATRTTLLEPLKLRALP